MGKIFQTNNEMSNKFSNKKQGKRGCKLLLHKFLFVEDIRIT